MSDSFFERAGSAAQIVSELGLQVDVRSGGHTTAHVVVQSAVCLPGGALRTSVLATWADVVTGMSASHAILPRIPVTLELETQIVRPPAGGATLNVTSVPVKIGQRIVTSRAEFVDAADGALVAISYASFIASPNPDHVLENGFPHTIQTEHRLPVPLEERTQRVIVRPGVVDLPRLPDGQNATGAIQGGLVSFGAEEAILSAVAPGAALESLTMRYFRPFMIGPARATATVTGPVATVELVDQGTSKVGAIATARLA